MAEPSTTFSFEPDYGIKPGETLAEILEARGMSQAELARRTGLSTKHVNQIVVGDISISPETGLRLEKVLGVSSRFWTTLDAHYREFKTRREETETLESDVPWLTELPVSELIKRGYVRSGVTKVEALRDVLAFFGVASRQTWGTVWARPTAYRQSRVHDVKPSSLAAWIRIGELRSAEVSAATFDRRALRGLLPELRGLTCLPVEKWHQRLISKCAAVGVIVVFEPEIPGSRISGVTRWIEHDHVLVEMSLRGKWADIFWFSFFHEIAHILLHDRKRITFVDGPPNKDEADDLEIEANDFASRLLIPAGHDGILSALQTRSDVRDFATSIGIHPGIVVGRLQHDGHIGFNQFNDLRERYVFA